MPPSMGRSYCQACNGSYRTNGHWLHTQSATHKRNVDRIYPLPPNPWAKKEPDGINASGNCLPI